MRVFLVGLPGSGKTRLGELMAEQLGLAFVDLDQRVEEIANRSIPELFAESEAVFRDLEHQALAAATKEEGVLIATGGGIVERGDNRAILRDELVLFLDIDVEEAIRRASRSDKRPLLQDEVATRLRALADRRRPWYEEIATIRVPLCAASKSDNAQIALQALKDYEEHHGNC